MISPGSPVSSVKGIGTVKKNALNKLNILTIEDLLHHFPRDYEDRREISKISGLIGGVTAQIRAIVTSVEDNTANYDLRNSKRPFKLLVKDESGILSVVYFNAAYLSNTFHIGDEFIFFGKVFRNGQMLQMTHPEFYKPDDDSVGRILPVYPLSAALSQKDFRKWIDSQLNALNKPDFLLDEFLPEDTIERNNICGIAYAFKNIHFPDGKRKLQEARYRLVFEELLVLQTGLFMLKSSRSVSDGIAFEADVDMRAFLASLPFNLTSAQERSLAEISADMESNRSMNRLLQGDVGSGKTVVAAAAMYKAVKAAIRRLLWHQRRHWRSSITMNYLNCF
ncbi:hypothetical protein FACS1894127_6980 [Clostridia bacterium]|nr:hypothetical protein FACS1894127_6980 [Clostridia bacterium]